MSRPRKRRADDAAEELLRHRGGPAWLADDESVPADELAGLLAGGWDSEHARHFASERRWRDGLQEYAKATREPVPALQQRLGLAPELVEGVDYVRTRAELEAPRG
ncbi:hypothetical protein ACI782_02840 [Geodermatophilus sp. SYSU D00703]